MLRDFSYRFIVSLVLLGSVECRTVYIAPSAGNAVCPSSVDDNSCMTLTQIAASSTAALRTESNLTIIFLPGNHTLNATDFSLASIPHVSMKSQSRDGFSMINCYTSSKFQFRFNGLVRISRLTLNECYEIEVHQVKEFVMEDCRLSGEERSLGRGLVVTNSTLNIRRTNFMSFHGSTTHKGGAVYCWHSSVSLSDCTFMKNGASSTSGAAVHIELNSTLISLNCSFSNNIICIDNDTDAIYGIVYANLSSVILLDSDFNNNSFYRGNLTTNYNGGVLSAFKSNVSISECTFIDNIAFNGGVIYCHRGAKLMISSTSFIRNKATNYI
jgi:predicted outer membrane repeat protein